MCILFLNYLKASVQCEHWQWALQEWMWYNCKQLRNHQPGHFIPHLWSPWTALIKLLLSWFISLLFQEQFYYNSASDKLLSGWPIFCLCCFSGEHKLTLTVRTLSSSEFSELLQLFSLLQCSLNYLIFILYLADWLLTLGLWNFWISQDHGFKP